MWYDRYKQETILVQQQEEHNKFWAAQLDEQTNKVMIRWGRLGTKGQTQEKTFDSQSRAACFIESKMGEKTRKGYKKVEEAKFNQLCVQAAIVGTSNKCHDFRWVSITNSDPISELTYHRVTEAELNDPSCNAAIFVEVETKKEYDGRHKTKLIITGSQTINVSGRHPSVVTPASPVHELTRKVEEALGRSFS